MNMNFGGSGGHYSTQYTALDPYRQFPFRFFFVDIPPVSPAQHIEKGDCYLTSPLGGGRGVWEHLFIYLLAVIMWTDASTLTGSHVVLAILRRGVSVRRGGSGIHLQAPICESGGEASVPGFN